MKATSSTTILNKDKIIEYQITVASVEFDGREAHFASLQFSRPELNVQFGREDWDCGTWETKAEAVKQARIKAREILAVVKAARKLPRKWAKINGRRVTVKT